MLKCEDVTLQGQMLLLKGGKGGEKVRCLIFLAHSLIYAVTAYWLLWLAQV